MKLLGAKCFLCTHCQVQQTNFSCDARLWLVCMAWSMKISLQSTAIWFILATIQSSCLALLHGSPWHLNFRSVVYRTVLKTIHSTIALAGTQRSTLFRNATCEGFRVPGPISGLCYQDPDSRRNPSSWRGVLRAYLDTEK